MYVEIFLLLGWITALALAVIKFQYKFWAEAPAHKYPERVIYDVVSKWLVILLIVLIIVAVFNLFS